MDVAKEGKLDVKMGALAKELYEAHQQAGHGSLDFSSIINRLGERVWAVARPPLTVCRLYQACMPRIQRSAVRMVGNLHSAHTISQLHKEGTPPN